MKPKKIDKQSLAGKADKEIIILRHGGGRLGNQLWLYTNVYAFCLENGYKCSNPSFFAYNKYYGFHDPNPLVKFFEFLNNFKINDSHASNYLFYKMYKYCSSLMPILQKGVVIKIKPDQKLNLPPTRVTKPNHKKIIRLIESNRCKYVYLDGGQFENPKGVKKYRKQITKKFLPEANVVKKVDNFLKRFRNCCLVAVHIRQGDYKRYRGGKLYFSQPEVASILRLFIAKYYKGNKKVKFILFSDSKIDLNNFTGLDIVAGFGPDSMIEDMLAMSRCDVIIASESSFSSYAAYYGDIPLLNFGRSKHGILGIRKTIYT